MTESLRTDTISWTVAEELIRSETIEVVSGQLCSSPLVTVAIVSYNQVDFIRECVDSVLAQQVEFEFEILIGDDQSVDGTQDILREFQAQHPKLIRLLLSTRRLGTHTGNGRLNFLRNLRNARGSYIALLDGDDFWTDPRKLSKQISALESHPAWSACFHTATYVDPLGNPTGRNHPPNSPAELKLSDLLENNPVQTCSLVFRAASLTLPDCFLKLPIADWPICFCLAAEGNLGFLQDAMSAYRCHPNSLWQSVAKKRKAVLISDMFSMLEHCGDPRVEHQAGLARRRTIELLLRRIEDLETCTSFRFGFAALHPLQWLMKKMPGSATKDQ